MILKQSFFVNFGANDYYNCGAYGEGAYNETSCTTSGGGGTTPGGGSDTSGGVTDGGGLIGTGMNAIALLILGIVLVAGSLLYIIKNLRKKSAQS